MTRAAEAQIDLRALQHNLQRVREVSPSSQVIAVIKANGYGHGMLRIARALSSVDGFAVASIDEALFLRGADIEKPIILLEGFFDADELEAILKYRLSVVIHNESQLRILESARLDRAIEVYLKIDTGMHRLGFSPDNAVDVYQRLRSCAQVKQPVCLMTHLANADDRSDRKTQTQIELFSTSVSGIEGNRSIANSAGILGWPQSHADIVRPGIMLYGVSPFIDTMAEQEGLKPVMTLSSRLITINHCKQGDTVGYGGEWICPEDMPIGVVSIGYGDGYPRSAVSGTPVLINGQRAPLIGRVSMDMICVDLRGLPQATIGDSVVLWGQGLPVEEIARCASTIPYDLLCAVTRRVNYTEIKI